MVDAETESRNAGNRTTHIHPNMRHLVGSDSSFGTTLHSHPGMWRPRVENRVENHSIHSPHDTVSPLASASLSETG